MLQILYSVKEIPSTGYLLGAKVCNHKVLQSAGMCSDGNLVKDKFTVFFSFFPPATVSPFLPPKVGNTGRMESFSRPIHDRIA